MELLRRFPPWAWLILGILLVILIIGTIVAALRGSEPRLPPGLVERREAVAKLLDQAFGIEDVDIRPLLELEEKKNYQGAVELMDKALSVNSLQEGLNAALVSVSDELTKLALDVEPDRAGAKAVEAFGLLAKLAEAERQFFLDRRALYEITRSYYADLAAKKEPPIPDNLRELVRRVNDDLEKAKDLQQQFAAAVTAFDELVQR